MSLGVPSARPSRTGAGPVRGCQFTIGPDPSSLGSGASRGSDGFPAGILFGVSDIAIKAISGLIGSDGITGLLTPWTLFCLVASVAAFYASAKSLQEGEAVPVIAVTGTAANVAGIVGGIIVFHDPLAGNPLLLAVECLAFVLVIAAAWLMPAPVRAASTAV